MGIVLQRQPLSEQNKIVYVISYDEKFVWGKNLHFSQCSTQAQREFLTD
jgi:hypothetical protein